MFNKYELTQIIERIAPHETAEPWDLSGWLVETDKLDVTKVMLCLTVTPDIIEQAKAASCDMIISHHPLFFIPSEFNCGIDIYCAHTNLDKAPNGTTETLIKKLGYVMNPNKEHDFLRYCDIDTNFTELICNLKNVSSNIRYTNPQNLHTVHRVAFCAGSGTEFWHDARLYGADVLVTGDLKFHTASDSQIAIIDIGHFESEVLVLQAISGLLKETVQTIIANETSPIKQINS